MSENIPEFIIELFYQLRSRGLPLGLKELMELKKVLRDGIGWNSTENLCRILCLLWAKSVEEIEIIECCIKRLKKFPIWQLNVHTGKHESDVPQNPVSTSKEILSEKHKSSNQNIEDISPIKPKDNKKYDDKIHKAPYEFPKMHLGKPDEVYKYKLHLLPQYPLNERDIAQSWGLLKCKISNSINEPDISEMVKRYCREGVNRGLVFRRVNVKSRILLLVDRNGSMLPLHDFVDNICKYIAKYSYSQLTSTYYFHDSPVIWTDRTALDKVKDKTFPVMDEIIENIPPVKKGRFFTNPNFSLALDMNDLFEKYARQSLVIIISDAGAARKKYDPMRIFDTISFIKTIKNYTSNVVWLNPLPRVYWESEYINNTATQIARYLPMFSLHKSEQFDAVKVLCAKDVEKRT